MDRVTLAYVIIVACLLAAAVLSLRLYRKRRRQREALRSTQRIDIIKH